MNDHLIVSGDLFASDMETYVNAVNCRGVMGAGVAKIFKQRYPEMFADYQKRCQDRTVKLGEPYLWDDGSSPKVLNFPTKDDWRDSSLVEPICQGLDYLVAHYQEWGITSIACPALGCGRGGLHWDVIRPIMIEKLSLLAIPVRIYRPLDS